MHAVYMNEYAILHDLPRAMHATAAGMQTPTTLRHIFHTTGVLPGLIFLLLVFLLPLGQMLWLSVSDPIPGFGQYHKVLDDKISLVIILRTLKVSFIVASVSVLLAYPYAYLMTLVASGMRSLMTLVVLIPFWTSLMARTFAWLVIFQSNGPLDALFKTLGWGELNLLGTSTAVTIGMTQTLMPFAVFPLYATLQGIDRKLLFAARSLGASRCTAFCKVYLPLSESGIIISWFLVFVLSLGFYITPQLLGSTHDALLSQYIAIKIADQLDFGFGSALATSLLIATLALLAIIALTRRIGQTLSTKET